MPRVLIADAGRVPGPDQQFPARGLEAGLLGELAPCRGFGLLPFLVECPGGDLEHQRVDGGPVLAHQCHGAVVVHGDDRDGAGMPDDDALERLVVGVQEVQPVHAEQPGLEELLLRDAAEARHGAR